VVRTARLDRILEYAPADMVLVAEAGVTLAQLQTATAAHGQRLALDAPHPTRATVGGLVAVGASGPLRARAGGIRELIIGVSLVRADGSVAKSGGKVVKNVAGYDLPKLACGSLGTLGLVASANFRLHPLPEARAMVRLPGLAPAQVPALLKRAREAQLEPAAAFALRTGPGNYELAIVFEGFEAGVAQQVAKLRELARLADRACDTLSEAAALALRARHDAVREGTGLCARLSAPPSRFEALEAALAPVLEALQGAAFTWYPTVGLGWVAGTETAVPALCAALSSARQVAVGLGGTLVLEAASQPVRELLDAWGPPPSSLHLMERLKRAFDPRGLLNPGRFPGGL
jgi:glycolate oxidase FAD binding subunit